MKAKWCFVASLALFLSAIGMALIGFYFSASEAQEVAMLMWVCAGGDVVIAAVFLMLGLKRSRNSGALPTV